MNQLPFGETKAATRATLMLVNMNALLPLTNKIFTSKCMELEASRNYKIFVV